MLPDGEHGVQHRQFDTPAGAVGIWQVARRGGAALGRFPTANNGNMRHAPEAASIRPFTTLANPLPRSILSGWTDRRNMTTRLLHRCSPVGNRAGWHCYLMLSATFTTRSNRLALSKAAKDRKSTRLNSSHLGIS